MVEIIGSLERAMTEGGTDIQVWRIPALSETLARQRAKGNGRVKGMGSVEVTSVENVGQGQIPGQSIYEVTIESPN